MSNMDIGPQMAKMVKGLFAGIFKMLFRAFKKSRAKKAAEKQQQL